MRPVLLDTNAYASFKRADSEIMEVIQRAELIGISPIVIGELFAGFDGGNKARQNRIELKEFMESTRVRVYSITLDTSHFFSQIFCALKKKGKPIPANDLWFAAQALEHGCVVCTHDKHFDVIEGLIAGCTTAELFI